MRVGLVTGGTSGIGLAVTEELVAHGWRVHVTARTPERSFRERENVHLIPCDIRDPEQVRAAIDSAAKAAGRLDGLVSCAGIARMGALDSQEPSTLDDMFRTNVLGTLFACQAALPHLERTRGAIVLVGSTLADHPRPLTSAYAATKGAIDSLTKALAVELGPRGVRINCVRPSLVRTDLMLKNGVSRQAYESTLHARAQAYPLRRVGEPADVARSVRFLLSEESDWTTGAIVDVDGGHAAAGS